METIIKKEFINDKRICRVFAVGAFVIFMLLSAFVRLPLPFTPVPLTLQTFFVLLSGSLLGKKLGLFAQIFYLLFGLAGQPVFAGTGSGTLYLFGPTGGYIVGFILSAFLTGYLFENRDQGKVSVFLKFLLGDFFILACGTLWLKISFSISLSHSFLIGFLPFVLGDILKVALATIVYSSIHSRVKSILY